MNLSLLLQSFVILAKGIPVTCGLVVISSLIGICIAVLVNVFANTKILSPILKAYVFFFRGTPLFLQLFLIYYGVGEFIQYLPKMSNFLDVYVFKNAFIYALVAMTLNTGAYGSVIIKGAISAIPYGQIEAAKSLGFNKFTIAKRIIIPQSFFYALPAYSNEIVLLVKGSSLASLVTIMDITGYMSQVRSNTYAFYEPFLVAAIFYLFINYSIIFIFRNLEKKSKNWLIYK
ncbi:ABC transporter permease [Rickettsiales bacterium LUAb2]